MNNNNKMIEESKRELLEKMMREITTIMIMISMDISSSNRIKE